MDAATHPPTHRVTHTQTRWQLAGLQTQRTSLCVTLMDCVTGYPHVSDRQTGVTRLKYVRQCVRLMKPLFWACGQGGPVVLSCSVWLDGGGLVPLLLNIGVGLTFPVSKAPWLTMTC